MEAGRTKAYTPGGCDLHCGPRRRAARRTASRATFARKAEAVRGPAGLRQAAASSKSTGLRPRDGRGAGRRPESVDQPAEVSPGNDHVPGEESRRGNREPEEHQVEEEEERLAPEAFVAQRGRIVVHEMRQDGGRDPVTQEQIAEPEAGDHRRDDLPESPAGRVRESEDHRP